MGTPEPDFDFDVAVAPTPEGKPRSPLSYGVGGAAGYSVYAKAPHAQQLVAGDLLHFFGTRAGQDVWARFNGSAAPPWMQAAADAAERSTQISRHDRDTFAIYKGLLRLAPSPQLRNPENAQVYLALKSVQPDLGAVCQGVLTGQIADAKRALEDLDRRSENALDFAIAAARKKGAKVSRDDWKFPSWNPDVDFGQKDY